MNDLGEKGVDVYITKYCEKTKTKILLIWLEWQAILPEAGWTVTWKASMEPVEYFDSPIDNKKVFDDIKPGY